jgi:hypothetical protein
MNYTYIVRFRTKNTYKIEELPPDYRFFRQYIFFSKKAVESTGKHVFLFLLKYFFYFFFKSKIYFCNIYFRIGSDWIGSDRIGSDWIGTEKMFFSVEKKIIKLLSIDRRPSQPDYHNMIITSGI